MKETREERRARILAIVRDAKPEDVKLFRQEGDSLVPVRTSLYDEVCGKGSRSPVQP